MKKRMRCDKMKNNIGPLSKDLVVACAIHHLRMNKKEARWPELVDLLKGKLMQSEIPSMLRSLVDWGIVNSEYTKLESGRAGRVYYISSEARKMIKETYELYWAKVMKDDKESYVRLKK